MSDRICRHMNQDHRDAVTLYAQVFGNMGSATTAEMVKIDAQGMDLLAQVEGTSRSLRIEFDHTLVDAKDAHVTLVEMLKQVRS